MARNTDAPVRQYRGTTDQHATYAGPIGEITVDITKPTAVVQDGSLGGHPLALEERTISSADDALVLKVGETKQLAVDLSKDFSIGLDIEGLASELVDEIVKDMVSEKLEGSLIDEDDDVLGTNEDGKINSSLCLAYEAGTGKFSLTGKNEKEICSVTVPSATSALQSVTLVDEADDRGGSKKLLRFVFLLDSGETTTIDVDLTDLFNPFSAGDGISISDSGEISVDIEEDGGLVFEDGKLAVDSSKLGCAMIYEATEETPGNLNQIQCMEDQLYVPTDYGTMDD